jgi:hypothetical protein
MAQVITKHPRTHYVLESTQDKVEIVETDDWSTKAVQRGCGCRRCKPASNRPG